MTIEPGRKLAHYEIVEPIGKGGMGEVYRAHDSKLGRDVAIKVLPDDLARDEERLRRFQREAKVLAALNHSNVAAIYGLEQSGDTHYLVLELVPGETLAERIARGPIPVDEAIDIATKIAEALEEAHEHGIVHRDLKPANIKLTDDGKVKVLDFGLAKAFAEDGAEGDDAVTSMSPTITRDATRVGVILGTAAYMSPEQAKGKKVDEQTDIFAFGAVLYEMLTAKKAFAGDGVSETLAAVIKSEPRWDVLPASMPFRLRELVRRCLRKDKTLRLQHMGDARIELHDAESFESETPSSSRRDRWRIPAFMLGAAIAGVVVWTVAPPPPTSDPRPVHFLFERPEGETLMARGRLPDRVAMSSDGNVIAYVGIVDKDEERGDVQIYLRHLGETEGRPIPGTEGAQSPFFSADGAWIGFLAAGKLQKVPVAGGTPLEICPLRLVQGASWGADESIVFGGGMGYGLFRVPSSGGTPEQLTYPDIAKGEIHHGYPAILPDGKNVLFTIGAGDGSRIAKLSLDTRDTEELLSFGSRPHYVPPGYIVFSEKGNLRLSRFDADTARVVGSVVPVLDGVEWMNGAGLEKSSFAVSQRGDLVFVSGGLGVFQTTPTWVDRRGNATRIDAERVPYLGSHISPDGTRVIVERANELGIGELWVMRVDGTRAFPFAAGGAAYNAVWSKDGTKVTYTLNGDIFEKRVDRDEEPEALLSRDEYLVPESWSPDGRLLAYTEITLQDTRVWVLPRDGEPEPLFEPSVNSSNPRFAPDSSWIAYVSEETGRPEVYLRRYPFEERGRQLSTGGGRAPVWSKDGSELFYRQGYRMMAVAITTEPELVIGEPELLWEAPYFLHQGNFTSYDVAADGRFLMLEVPEVSLSQPTRVHVHLDWLAATKDRLAVAQ